MRLLTPDLGPVSHAAFSPTGRHLVLAGDRGFALSAWPAVVADQNAFHVVPTADRLVQAAWHPDGSVFALGGVDGVVQIWDQKPKLRKELIRLPGQDGMMTAVAFSPDGAVLAFGDGWAEEAGCVLLVRTANWTVVDRLEQHKDMIGALAFVRPDVLVSGGADKGIVVQRLDDALAEPRAFEVAARVQGLAARDGQLAVAEGGRIHLWTLDADGFPLPTPGPVCRGHGPSVRGIVYAPDGRTLVSAGEDGTLRFWDANSGLGRAAFDVRVGPLRTVAVAPDGLTAVAAGDSGTVVVVDVE